MLGVFDGCVISFEGYLSKEISVYKNLVIAAGGRVADTLSDNVNKKNTIKNRND